MKKNKLETSNNQESGKSKGCSEQTEQPLKSISEDPSETEEKLDNQVKKGKCIVLPIRF